MSDRSSLRMRDRAALGAVWADRHLLRPALRLLAWPFRRVFKLVAWLALGLVGWALVQHLRSGPPDPKWIVALAALALVSALVAQLGADLIPRIKKLGPLELFEEQASGLVAALDGDEIGRLAQAQPRHATVLSAEQRFAYEQADFYISMMELNRIDLSKDPGRRGRLYRELLWAVAGTAYSLRDFPRALSRLELCRKFPGPPETLDYSEGLVHYFWSMALDKTKDAEERERHLDRAFRSFSLAVRRRQDSHRAFSFLALVCSARGDYGLAIRYNGRALAVRPQLALARYNRACDFLQIGRPKRALASLQRLESGDEGIEEVRTALSGDPDLADLRDHPVHGAEVHRIYLKLGGKEEGWRQPRG
jgi:tetratricopeptide (TPR) repeat protein